VKELEKWFQSNPLRKYLDQQEPRWGSVCRFAENVGFTRPAVYKWLSGGNIPGLESVRAIERVTGITFNDWLAWYDRKPKVKARRKCRAKN